MGSSLGWLLQLDGDAHRNAFLNSPWARVVVPIRGGREAAALNWLTQAHVEGTDGLDETVVGAGDDRMSLREAITKVAKEVASLNDPTNADYVLAPEKVFETGFDPLERGFQATGEPFAVVSQWVEVMPTDQVVAVEYTP